MNDLPIINLLPPKYRPWATAAIMLSPYITRTVYALMNRGGLRGVFSAIWLGTNTPKISPQQDPTKTNPSNPS